ncbi:hypothetical protein HK101_001573, partial [Irineochytrium annulatum]
MSSLNTSPAAKKPSPAARKLVATVSSTSTGSATNARKRPSSPPPELVNPELVSDTSRMSPDEIRRLQVRVGLHKKIRLRMEQKGLDTFVPTKLNRSSALSTPLLSSASATPRLQHAVISLRTSKATPARGRPFHSHQSQTKTVAGRATPREQARKQQRVQQQQNHQHLSIIEQDHRVAQFIQGNDFTHSITIPDCLDFQQNQTTEDWSLVDQAYLNDHSGYIMQSSSTSPPPFPQHHHQHNLYAVNEPFAMDFPILQPFCDPSGAVVHHQHPSTLPHDDFLLNPAIHDHFTSHLSSSDPNLNTTAAPAPFDVIQQSSIDFLHPFLGVHTSASALISHEPAAQSMPTEQIISPPPIPHAVISPADSGYALSPTNVGWDEKTVAAMRSLRGFMDSTHTHAQAASWDPWTTDAIQRHLGLRAHDDEAWNL